MKEVLESDIPFIIEEYKKTIDIPPLNSDRKRIVLCPVGIVGAGKSTVTIPLAKKLSLVRISGDEIRKTMYDNGFDTRGKAWAIGKLIIEDFVSKGYSIAIDSDCATPGTVDGIEKLENEAGMLPIWIHINTPEEFIIQKLTNHEPTWLFKNSAEALDCYYKRKPLHEHLDFPFVYTFDTSKDNVEEQIDEAYRLIEEKRSN